jgi:hypothetical protein
MAALGTRLLTFTLDGEEVTAQVSNLRIAGAAADADFTSFEDAKNGGAREYHLVGTAAQDIAEDTIWDKIWTASGTTVPVIIKPAGGTTASPTQPHFTGNVTIVEPDGDLLGGEANASKTAKFTIDFDWTFDAKPTKVTA